MLIFLVALASASAITVLTSPWPPVVICDIGSSNAMNFSGFELDLLREIATSLRWTNLTILCVNWDDIFAGLEAGTADIGLGGINIDSARLQKVQFSVPTYESSISLVTTQQRASLTWVVLEPFSWQLWTALVVAGLVMAHALWLLEGMEKTYPRGIIDAVWLAFASLFLTSDRSARLIPGKMLQLGLGLSAFLLLGLFIGCLTVRLATPIVDQPLTSYQDLRDMRVGTPSSYVPWLSHFSDHVKGFDWMPDDPSALIIEAVKQGELDVAALEHPQAQYYSTRKCGITVLDFSFIEIYYAAAFPLGADKQLMRDFSKACSQLKERGVQKALMNKYTSQAAADPCSNLIPLNALSASQVLGVLAVLSAGFLAALPLNLFQLLRKSRSSEEVKAQQLRQQHSQREAQELKLVRKFDTILLSADQKLGAKLTDLEYSLERHLGTSMKYEEALMELEAKLDRRFA
jgi:ABC-type amino acid transport substrate-binding protein